MATMQTFATVLASAGTPLLFVGLAFSNDMLFSKATSDAITAAIRDVSADPAKSRWTADLQNFLAEYFPPRGQPGKFWTYVCAMSLVSMACVLAVYCSRMPDLIPQLTTPGFLGQFLFDGFVKVALVNAFAYRFQHHLIQSLVAGSTLANIALLLADAFCKALLFVALTLIIYVGYAHFRGAFGGDVMSAIKSVPITIQDAVRFHNLTGVYIYALPLSSFPIYLLIIMKLFVLHPGFARKTQRVIFFMPIAEKPIRAAALVFFVFASVFATAMALLVAYPAEALPR